MKMGKSNDDALMHALEEARALSHANLGKRLDLYVPGMFKFHDMIGRYPVVSITGQSCGLKCDHCAGKMLESMIDVSTPELLLDACRAMRDKGDVGCLLSGGSDREGRLPWKRFLPAIRQAHDETSLRITAHTGLLDRPTARALKDAGIERALIDVIGSRETMKKVYHLDAEPEIMEESLSALEDAGLPIVPHVVVGLDYGKIVGEERALEMISRHHPSTLVIVVFFPLRGTMMESVRPAPEEEVARLIVNARKLMPNVPISLSCARPHGEYRRRLDELGLLAGVNKIAVPSAEAVNVAQQLGLEIRYHPTCCSID